MTTFALSRRNLLAAGGAVRNRGFRGRRCRPAPKALHEPVRCWCGANNYRKARWWIGSARVASGLSTAAGPGHGAPLAGQRIQIWAHTTEGQEHEPQSRDGATLTDKDGKFRSSMPGLFDLRVSRMVISPMTAVNSKPSFYVP